MFCDRAKEFLSQNKVPYTDRNIADDESALDELTTLGFATTPVIVVDDEVVVGFDHAQLTQLLGL